MSRILDEPAWGAWLPRTRHGLRAWALLPVLGALTAPLSGTAQECEAPRRCAVSWRIPTGEGGLPGPAYVPEPSTGGWSDPERALLLSAAVPGAGQYVQGQRRWVAYLAAELVGWWLVIDRRRDGGRLRDRYRDLAWSVAREGLGEGPRTDGGFDYYEDLSHWERSGAFDRDPDLPGVQPEDDPATFNGSVWNLARDIFFSPDAPPPQPGDPTWERALEYYRDRAWDSRFLWDWSGHPAEWARYGETIEASDDRFRQATLFTGAVVANHLLSAVDAFVSARLSSAAGRKAALETRLRPGPGGRRGGARVDLILFLPVRGP